MCRSDSPGERERESSLLASLNSSNKRATSSHITKIISHIATVNVQRWAANICPISRQWSGLGSDWSSLDRLGFSAVRLPEKCWHFIKFCLPCHVFSNAVLTITVSLCYCRRSTLVASSRRTLKYASVGTTLGKAPLSTLNCHLLCSSLQSVLGLTSLDGVLSPKHVNGKHIVHNVFSVNKSGIVVLENKAGTRWLTHDQPAVTPTPPLTHCVSFFHPQRTCHIGWCRPWSASPIVSLDFLLARRLSVENIAICLGTVTSEGSSTWRADESL